MDEGESYAAAGVDIEAGDLAVQLIKDDVRSTFRPEVIGDAEVVNGTKQYRVRANESTFIPAGEKHRLANMGTEDLVIIEVQTGSYLGEDDIVRFEDVYGRA